MLVMFWPLLFGLMKIFNEYLSILSFVFTLKQVLRYVFNASVTIGTTRTRVDGRLGSRVHWCCQAMLFGESDYLGRVGDTVGAEVE